jgi:flagellin
MSSGGVVLNSNISSISASRILANNRASLEKAMERLASGKRINSAADDAAGMAVAAKLRQDARSLDQAVRNTNDAISMLNTYDGGSAEVENILVRMRELAVQVSNGTYASDDVAQASLEYDALVSEIDRIAEATRFNRISLSGESYTFFVGAENSSTIGSNEIEVDFAAIDSSSLGLASGDISTASLAITNNETIEDALNTLAGHRAEVGALVNRMGHTASNLMNISQHTKEALSGIEDADYASESAALARGMVLAQAGTAMLAQANQSPQYVLTLLRNI